MRDVTDRTRTLAELPKRTGKQNGDGPVADGIGREKTHGEKQQLPERVGNIIVSTIY